MEALPLYAMLWLLPFLLVLLVPRVVRKVRGPGPEPRMTDANFLVKMRLHNYMKESQYMLPRHASVGRWSTWCWGTRTAVGTCSSAAAGWVSSAYSLRPLLHLQETGQPPEEGRGVRLVTGAADFTIAAVARIRVDVPFQSPSRAPSPMH